jgi:hypothetical protein
LAKSKNGVRRPKEEGREGTRSILSRDDAMGLNNDRRKVEETGEGTIGNKWDERKSRIRERLSIRTLLGPLTGSEGNRVIECSVALVESMEMEDDSLRTYSIKCVSRSRRSVVRCWSKESGARDNRIEDSEIKASDPRTGKCSENIKKGKKWYYTLNGRAEY